MGRGDFNAKITLPSEAGVTKAVLSMNGAEMQDNVDYSTPSPPSRTSSGEADIAIGVGQYWANVTDEYVHIPRVRAGTYRLTVYAEGVFGQLEMDDIVVQAGDGAGEPFAVEWKCESHGTFRHAF